MSSKSLNPNAKPFSKFHCPKPINPNDKPFFHSQLPKPLNPNAMPFRSVYHFPVVQTYIFQWRPVYPPPQPPRAMVRVHTRHNNTSMRKRGLKWAAGRTGNKNAGSFRNPNVRTINNMPPCLVRKSRTRSNGNRTTPFPPRFFDQRTSDTTVMVKNIPNQFRRCTLLSILQRHCREENKRSEHKSKFDFVYLPMDFNQYWENKRVSNLGYAFVNFTSHVAAVRFCKHFHNREWRDRRAKKTCEVRCAKIQGKDALVKNFKNSVFWCHSDLYLPAVFEPASDGQGYTKLINVGARVCAPSRKSRNKKVK